MQFKKYESVAKNYIEVYFIHLCFRYLATGNSTLSIAFSFRVGESTVRQLIKEVCSVITNKLWPIYVTLPTKEQWKNIIDGYWNRWNMPNCFGAIDGKHIFLYM